MGTRPRSPRVPTHVGCFVQSGFWPLAPGGWYPILCRYEGQWAVSIDGEIVDIPVGAVEQASRGLVSWAVCAIAPDGSRIAVCPEGHHVPPGGAGLCRCRECDADYEVRDEAGVTAVPTEGSVRAARPRMTAPA